MTKVRSLLVFLACCLLSACSVFQPRPNLIKHYRAAMNYAYARCQNSRQVRALADATDADFAISNIKRSTSEGLRLDRALAICSENASDPWVAQVTKAAYLTDESTDKLNCPDNKKMIASDAVSAGDSSELITLDYEIQPECEAAAAEARLRAVQAITRSTSFDDVRAFSKNWSPVILSEIKADKNVAASMERVKFKVSPPLYP